MHKRTAAVENIDAISIEFSSIFNIGDTVSTDQHSRGIALQKEGAVFTKQDNLNFADYPIFKRKANLPEKNYPVTTFTTTHHGNTINVQQVSLIGLSQSAVFQVGSINKISAEARVKHFRKLKGEHNF